MTELELIERRRAKWRTDGAHPLRTFDDAAAFMADVGFCFFHAAKMKAPMATFIGAFTGSDERLPALKQAYDRVSSQAAHDLVAQLLRQRAAFEVPYGADDFLLLAPDVFPFFYALAAGRHLKRDLAEGSTGDKVTPLGRDVYALIQKHGPLAKGLLAERLGGALSETAIERALVELWRSLLILKTGYRPAGESLWDSLERWAPSAVRRGSQLSLPEAFSALVSKYVEAAIAVTPGEIEEFFSEFASRAKVRQAINALLAAREFAQVSVGRKTALEVTPAVATLDALKEKSRAE